MDPTIRRIRPGEGGLLREIRLRALKSDPDAFGSTYQRARSRADEEWEEAAARAATGREQFLAVAEHGGRFVGMAGAYAPDDATHTRHLYGMWVAPEARSAGVGSLLMAAVVDWATEVGADEVTLWVVDTNRAALALYERAGFKATDVNQPLPSNPDLTETRFVLRLG